MRRAQIHALRRGQQLDGEDDRGVSHRSPSLRAANVAMDTWSSWFAEVGSESTLAGCASSLFSEASAAAVTCAIMNPEFTPPSLTRNGGRPGKRGVDEQRDAPLGQRADLGHREREIVGRERHRLGVEVAARQHLGRVGPSFE